MFSGLLSAMLLGTTMTYLDLELKTPEEVEEEDINIYAYYSELNKLFNQNDAELRYFENHQQGFGTFETPLPGNDTAYHLFSYTPESYDESEDFYALISFYVKNVLPANDSLAMIENLEGYEEAKEGYEWRAFEMSIRNLNSTDPNIGVWMKQDDFTIYEDENTPIESNTIIFDEFKTDVELYELNRYETIFAKQVPIDKPFYIVYGHEDSEDEYVTYVENISTIERDQ